MSHQAAGRTANEMWRRAHAVCCNRQLAASRQAGCGTTPGCPPPPSHSCQPVDVSRTSFNSRDHAQGSCIHQLTPRCTTLWLGAVRAVHHPCRRLELHNRCCSLLPHTCTAWVVFWPCFTALVVMRTRAPGTIMPPPSSAGVCASTAAPPGCSSRTSATYGVRTAADGRLMTCHKPSQQRQHADVSAGQIFTAVHAHYGLWPLASLVQAPGSSQRTKGMLLSEYAPASYGGTQMRKAVRPQGGWGG